MPNFNVIPAFKFSLLLAAGIIIGSIYYFNPLYTVILILSCSFLLLFIKNDFVKLPLTFLVIILFGIFKSNTDFFIFPENSIKFFPETNRSSNVRLTGIINGLPYYDSTKIKFIVESKKIITGHDTVLVSGTVSVTLREDKYSSKKSFPPDLKAGDEIEIKGKLQEASGMRNPGEFDYRKYLFLNGIYKTFTSTGYGKIKIISENNLTFIEQKIIFPSKIYALNCIDRNMKGDAASYLKGLVTGERSDISDEIKTAFVNAGVMHLIAVSGLNVAYIIISVTLVLSLLRIPLIPRTVTIIIILIFYCMFTGSPASIVRAGIMGITLLISFLIQRKINFLNAVGFSAALILIYNSKQLFNPGFILSYASVISMVLIYNFFEKFFVKNIFNGENRFKKVLLWISVLFFTTLAAQLGTIPLTINYFSKVSVISLLANVVVVPAANLSLAIGFFQILTSLISEYLSTLIAEVNTLMLTLQLSFIKWCASFDFAFINMKMMNLFSIVSYYLVLILMISMKDKYDLIKKIVFIILIISLAALHNFDFRKNLKITFLDIGQGDCALIETPDDKNILVDCGMISDYYNSGERTIGPYLVRNGIKKIDLLILTHLHNDHIGGINYLLENFEICRILESGQRVNTEVTRIMEKLIAGKNISREIIRSGDVIDDIENMRLYFLFPGNSFINNKGETVGGNLNNGSIAFILKYKNNSIFFSGDIEKEAERFLYENYSDFLKTDVLKVAHHGSFTSSSIPFIIKNKPGISVISCGKFNKFNHPSDIILNRLEKSGSEIIRTDISGAVILESNGFTFSAIDWRK